MPLSTAASLSGVSSGDESPLTYQSRPAATLPSSRERSLNPPGSDARPSKRVWVGSFALASTLLFAGAAWRYFYSSDQESVGKSLPTAGVPVSALPTYPQPSHGSASPAVVAAAQEIPSPTSRSESEADSANPAGAASAILGVPNGGSQAQTETVASVPSHAVSRIGETEVAAAGSTGAPAQNEERGKVEGDRQLQRSRESSLPEAADKPVSHKQPEADEQRFPSANKPETPNANRSSIANQAKATQIVNAPQDGFLALRSEPDIKRGFRVDKIPHGATLQIDRCQAQTKRLGKTNGRWCQTTYLGQDGWVFDGFLVSTPSMQARSELVTEPTTQVLSSRGAGSGASGYPGIFRSISTPSFSCAGRLTPVEFTICADPALARADGIMGALYHDLRAKLGPTGADALRSAQRAWIKRRDRLCPTTAADRYSAQARIYTVACLQRLVDERIAQLQADQQ